MATYNGAKYVEEQIFSILKQSFVNFELIISDDGSSDDTIKIINKYVDTDSRIKLVFNEGKHGFKNNFINALKYANGDYVAFCDQDDIWTENHLEILLNKIGSNDLIGANADLVDSNGVSLGYDMKDVLELEKVPSDEWKLLISELYGNIFQGTALLITSDLANKLKSIPEEVYFHDYWTALLALVNKGAKYIDDVVLLYRQHEGNVTVNVKKSYWEKKFDRKRKTELIERQLLLLEAFNRECNIDIIKNDLLDAMSFCSNRLSGKVLKNSILFIKIYNKIYYCRKKSFFLFIARFIKVLLNLY